MSYGKLSLDTIETSGNLAVTGNITSSGTLQPSALRGTAASTPPVFQDSTGTQIGTLCRAWVSANTTATPITISAAFNVSSITDHGAGDITVNFTNPMPDTGYSSVATALSPGNASFVYGYLTKTTSASRFRFVQFVSGTVGLVDSSSFCVAVFV
jgi:hypothetical protein